MSMLSLKGRLHKVFPQQQITDSFSKREFVIETDEEYPQFVKFELTQDKCDLVSKFSEGQSMEVFFNVRGREWNEKFFTNLNAWRILEIRSESRDDEERKKIDAHIKSKEVVDANPDTPDDLPF